MKCRIISMALVLSLLIGTAVRPQRANAVAVTAAVVTAASAAAILTACGVSYWAASQTDAIDYISGKLEDYLESIDVSETPADWLGISGSAQPFTVITGGAMQFTSAIANKLLDFCSWFQTDEGLESGGEAVGNFVLPNGYSVQIDPTNYVGTVDVKLLGDNRFAFTLNGYQQAPYSNYLYVDVYVPAIAGNCWLEVISNSIVRGTSGRAYNPGFQLEGDTQTWSSKAGMKKSGKSSGDTWRIRIDIGNYGTDFFDGTVVYEVTTGVAVESEATAKVTPSDFINVPASLDLDGTFTLNPSVQLAEGDTVEEATQAILDGITSEEGLSSTVEDTPNTAWGWLYTLLVNIVEAITDGVADIKQAVLGLADSIYNKFTSVLQDIKTGINTLRQDVVTALGDVKQAVIGIPSKIDEAKQAILGLPSRIADAVRGLFVPAVDWADTYVSTLYNTFADRVGVLTYPLAVAENFLMRFLTESVGDPVVSWGNVREPFSQQILIQAGSYNFNSLLADDQIARVYGILQLVLKTGMALTLFELCRKKYNTIIHGGAS